MYEYQKLSDNKSYEIKHIITKNQKEKENDTRFGYGT